MTSFPLEQSNLCDLILVKNISWICTRQETSWCNTRPSAASSLKESIQIPVLVSPKSQHVRGVSSVLFSSIWHGHSTIWSYDTRIPGNSLKCTNDVRQQSNERVVRNHCNLKIHHCTKIRRYCGMTETVQKSWPHRNFANVANLHKSCYVVGSRKSLNSYSLVEISYTS